MGKKKEKRAGVQPTVTRQTVTWQIDETSLATRHVSLIWQLRQQGFDIEKPVVLTVRGEYLLFSQEQSIDTLEGVPQDGIDADLAEIDRETA